MKVGHGFFNPSPIFLVQVFFLSFKILPKRSLSTKKKNQNLQTDLYTIHNFKLLFVFQFHFNSKHKALSIEVYF